MKKFKKIYIEITNICNLNCSFCSKSKRIKHEMSIEEFSIIIDKIKNYTENIYLHVKGEPLLHSKLDEILTICDDNNINVCITTNGTLLKEKIDILKKHKIKKINISLHSENNKINYFEDVFNSVNELKRKTVIIYRLWTLSSLQLDDLSKKIADKIIDYYKLEDDIIKKIYTEKNIKIIDNVYLDKDYEFEWPKIKEEKNNFGTCLGTRNQLAILSNGNVTACCLDSEGIINFGNIYINSMEEILNSELFIKMRMNFENKKVICSLCQSCTYRNRFK